ncbi:Hypothetical protein LUCI_1522 [Lucifera butyrica]|uniref:YcaO domain-containing protein n=1 Tax=Lucifera butyrica TaxID=1351585 RepID=A0A498R7Y5_9FIRM|nr:YcaO-like family protein [Lucifera butyrica]VBB06293.1 Hypothetical protein LUCI_1522 [Lucifera butyrica]
MAISDSHYKDRPPLTTIHTIRTILKDLDLLTIETVWKNSVEGFFSVTVQIVDTCLSTNGKGATADLALASAYGELMERLQNQATFRLNLDLRQEALEYLGFFYAPDEKKMSFEEVLSSKEDWFREQWNRLDPAIDKAELLQRWMDVSYETIPADFIALPYLNRTNNQISYIPVKMASKMYMSNGMCAGNTLEEAVVQGISEIMERFANQKIINERLCPPDIPGWFINKYSNIASMIAKLKASSNCEIILKDCSLGLNFPVVGVIYINKDTQNYFVKFGAHPIFEIAAERTLTELLQGQDIHRMMGVREFCYHSDLDAENLMGILVNGSGFYPANFFSHNYSYDFKELEDVHGFSNKELLTHLIQLLARQGYSTFIRDVSFLGFPAFHVIVPGLSEIEKISDRKAITDYAEYNKIRRLLRSLPSLTDGQREELIRFLETTGYSPVAAVTDLLNLSLPESLPWYYSNIDLFLTALHYQKGDFAKAYTTFNRFLENNKNNNPSNPSVVTYYKCVRDYIATRTEKLNDEEALDILSTFYPPNIVHGVISEFGNQTTILSYLGQLNCWNCNSCPYKEHCSYLPTEKAYRKLKESYAQNPLNQIHLSR